MTIDLEAAHELASDMAGTIEHLASLHATLGAIENNHEHRLMASTLSGLLRHAKELVKTLEPLP